MKQNLTILLNLMCGALFLTSIIIADKEPIFAACCFTWSIFYFIRSNKFISKIKLKAFTLIELIAVIAVMSILLSILMLLKTDSNKLDASRVNAYLIQVQTYSYDSDEIIPTYFSDKYRNEVVPSEDLYFKRGVPVKANGSPIIACKVRIIDNKGIEKDIVIKINTFTGKISFY